MELSNNGLFKNTEAIVYIIAGHVNNILGAKPSKAKEEAGEHIFTLIKYLEQEVVKEITSRYEKQEVCHD